MEQLPLELWFLITEFLSDEDLYNLIGVSRFFFELAMDRKYCYIRLDGPAAFKKLDRISDPSIARRVKTFNVSLYQFNAPVSDQGASGIGSPLSALRQAVSKTVSKIMAPTSTSSEPKQSPCTMVSRVTDVLPLLVNVDVFRLTTWSLPHTEDVDNFYREAWSVMSQNLRCLSIAANPDGLRKFLKGRPSFPALRQLEVAFADGPSVEGSFSGGSPEEVVPLINSVASQLEVLKIRSFSKLDLSSLFLNLAPLPLLETTAFRIPFPQGFAKDSSGFKTFLIQSSSTLKNIDIRLAPIALALDPNTERGLQDFLSDCLRDPACFANIRCMDIYPTKLPDGVEILQKAVRNSSLHLTEFTVRDRYLKMEEVLELCKELRSCLQLTYLRMNINYLACEVFDALSRDAPGLRRLWLSIGEAAPDRTASQTMEAVRTGMKDRSYPNWKLWDLTIYQTRIELDDETMKACVRALPSVKSYWGQGTTRELDGNNKSRGPVLLNATHYS